MRTRRSIQIVAAVIAVGALASACGSSDSASTESSGVEGAIEGELLPFSLMQEDGFVFEGDPSDPGRGIFRVRTTEPMICTIVWGETDEFGNFNNSLAMNGTGIIHHDVILPGAEAGKTYSFRVQGSTADGKQYRSETGTFTIPEVEGGGEADEMAGDGTNLALDATIVDVSSIFGPGWEAGNAIDDDTNTEWATAGDGDGGFIVLDLESTKDVAGVEFLTRSMLDGTATTEMYTVTVGDDTFGPFPAGNPANPRFTEIEFTAQEVRFDIETSTGGNVGAIEVRVFGPAES